jgi:hypothetical protein
VQVLALLLFLWLGPRAAFAELIAELLIGLAVISGGGGTRIRDSLRMFLERTRAARRRRLRSAPAG